MEPWQRAVRRLRVRAGRWVGRAGSLLAPAVGRTRRSLRPGLAALAARSGLRGWRAGVAVAATGVLAVFVAFAALSGPPRLMPGPGGSMPEIIGFYQNGWSAAFRSSLRSVKQHYNTIDTVLAFWYSVDGSGGIKADAPSPNVTAWVKAHHMRMGVLINNVAGSSGSNSRMLTDAAARARAVAGIVSLVHASGYQEVNIDFELLPTSARAGLVTFMQDLRTALPSTVRLSESVFPEVGVPASLTGAYNYPALARIVTYLVIMLYDNHSNGGPAGPVSPLPWVQSNMNWFLHTAAIPADKLVLGAGVYGYDWPVGSTTAKNLPLTEVNALLHSTGSTVVVDPVSENPHFSYTSSSGTRHVVWYQDEETLIQRLRLAQKLHLRGVAIWALGQETPAVWSGIEQTWGTKA